MSRYIDADKLKPMQFVNWTNICRAPSIDIVRCKDCKFIRLYDEGETKYFYCALEDRPNRQWSIDETDFCSWGERRE